MALLLVDNLVETLEGLEPNNEDPAILYKKLRAEEDVDYQMFDSESQVPDTMDGLVSEEHVKNGLTASILYKNPSICHTALLPAETRYLGILTESDKKGPLDYDKGMTQNSADKSPGKKDQCPMRLVFSEEDRQTCEVPLQMDYKDFFYTTALDGWTSLTIPNDAELAAYGPDFKPKGVLVLCFVGCNWGKCPKGNKQYEDFQTGELQMEVNGESVKNITRLSRCFAMQGQNGHIFKPNKAGRYVVRARVDSGYTRISSVIIL